MKKVLFLITSLLILGLVFAGCNGDLNLTTPGTTETEGVISLMRGTSGDPYVRQLFAGQDIDVGEIQVRDDGDYLYVKYVVDEPDWYLTETHLHVACEGTPIPVNKKGNPIPGHFDYGSEYEVSENVTFEEFTIPLEDISCCDLDIAAHAVVVKQLTDGGCAASVHESSQGTERGGSSVQTVRSDPTNALGSIDNSFFSLGFVDETSGGNIVLEFEDYVGTSLNVVEQSPGTEWRDTGYPVEQAKVWVSANLVDWTYLGMANNQIAGGSAPGQSHENVFDLEECIKFVKIVDQTDPTLQLGDTADAFDIDAVCGEPCYQEETAWADGTRFVQKGNWATYFQYCMCDPGLLNGGFEKPVLASSHSWGLFTSSSVEWIVEWYDACDEPPDAVIELHRNYWTPYQGNQYVELDTDCDPDIQREPASVEISQTLNTCPGWEYTVSFAYSPRPGHDDNIMEVYWDVDCVGTYTADGSLNTDTSWNTEELTLTASESETELKFIEVGIADCRGMLLDDVKVER